METGVGKNEIRERRLSFTAKHILIAVCIALFIVSFSCDLLTGPHKSGGVDTTSHAWTFEIDTLGDGASQLYDVAIVSTSPPLAYAVGRMYLKDSTGQLNPNIHNLAKWDGTGWTFLQVSVKLTYMASSVVTDQDPLQSVFPISENDVWFVSRAGGVTRLRYGNWDLLDIPYGEGPGAASKTWGTSSSNMYFVSNNGRIVRYDGFWHTLTSSTSLDIRDIWGSPDGSQVLAVAGSKILKIQGSTVSTISDSGVEGSLNGTWFVPDQKYYAVGGGIYWKNRLTDPVWNTYAPGVVTSYVSESIAGNDTNDVFVVGDSFEMLHYNGRSWYNYKDVVPLSYGVLGSVAMKGNLMIAVGFTGSTQQAIAIVGKRN